MDIVTDYNDIAESLGPINYKKESKAVASEEKKKKDSVDKAIRKAMSEAKEIEKIDKCCLGLNKSSRAKQ